MQQDQAVVAIFIYSSWYEFLCVMLACITVLGVGSTSICDICKGRETIILGRALVRSSKLDALALIQNNRALTRAHHFVKKFAHARGRRAPLIFCAHLRSKISSFLGQNFLFSNKVQFKRAKLRGFQPFFDNSNNQDYFNLQILKIKCFFSNENW